MAESMRERSTQATTPRTVTNQQMINAFARAAGTLGLADPWAFLARAGLNLTALVADREGAYQGPTIDKMPNLTDEERKALQDALDRITSGPTPMPPTTGTGMLRLNPELLAVPLPPDAAQQIPSVPSIKDPTSAMMARIWNAYGGLLGKVASLLSFDPALAAAVLAIESGGRAFGAGGRMIIRFEIHVFFNLWGKNNQEQFNRCFRFDTASPWRGDSHEWRPDENSEWRKVHAGQDGEWNAFAFARVNCSDNAAKLSISMGAPQIMGFNHARIGFSDVEAMYDAFENDERSQILGFFDFVRTDPRLLDAMRAKDLLNFATYYNGSAVAEAYSNLMRNAWSSLVALLPPTGSPPPTSPPPGGGGFIEPSKPPYGAPTTPTVPGRPNGAIPLPDQLPLPPIAEGALLRDVDPILYEAWRDHVREGFEQNSEMFTRVLDAFMEPYYTTVWMYRVLFAVGVLSFIAAVGLSIWTGTPWFGLIFGGLSIAAFISYFFNRPLQALEENLHFITWLGIIYNSYWTRLAYMFDQKTVQQDLKAATDDAVAELDKLLTKHQQVSGRRPNVTAGRLEDNDEPSASLPSPEG